MRNIFLAVVLIALGLSWLMPNHFLPWVSWQNEVLAFLAIILLAWLGVAHGLRVNNTFSIALPVSVLPFIALALLGIFQGITGVITFWGDVWSLLLYMALCVACLILGFFAGARSSVHLDKRDLQAPFTILAITLLAVASFSAVLVLAQVLDVWNSGWVVRVVGRRPGANLAQPNHLATLLLMGLVSLLFLNQIEKLGSLSSALIFSLLALGLAITESRTGALAFLMLLGWWLLKRVQVGFKLPLWVAVLASIGLLGLFWFWPYILNSTQALGHSVEVRAGAGTRLVVWPQLLEALALRPWGGWGLREVAKAHNAVVHAHLGSEPFSYSHNILIDLALGIGVPLAALLVLVTAVWLWRRVKAANHLLPWYCLGMALPLAVHSMLEYPFSYAYFLVPVMFLLGALEAVLAIKPVGHIGVRPVAVVLFVFTVAGGWSVLEYMKIEEDFRIARFEDLRIGQTPVDYHQPKIVLLTQLGALRESARMSPKPGMTTDELELLRNVALHYPSGAPLSRYALALALNGNPEEAVRQLMVIRALFGEGAYMRVKSRFENLAQSTYPQLLSLKLL